MRLPIFLARLLVSGSLIVSLPFAGESFAADIAAAPSLSSQTDTGGISAIPAEQPADSAPTLEIAPQPADNPPARTEVPDAREFRKSQDVASRERNTLRENSDRDHNPYLGISVEYSTHCYAGAEEHGFEVMNVYPGSPAARAGIHARTSSTPMGDLGALGSILFLPVSVITMPLLRRSGALGMDGDLIVAVDDQRVRSKGELVTMLHHLKPGDTTYITVIRPIPGGSHKTMRIALHIDREVDALGNPYKDKDCRVNHNCHPSFDPMLRKPFEAPAKDGTHSPDTESAAN
jgi:S1-C subfamily serine protease